LSRTDYERVFGADTTISEMTDQVRQFFLNGGSQAFVMRIADASAASAGVELKNESGVVVLRISAKDAGVDGGSIRIEVNYNTSSPESTFNLRAFRQVVDNFGVTRVETDETFSNLSMDPGSGRYAQSVINQQSSLINVDASIAPAPGVGYSRSGILVDPADNAAAIATLEGRLTETSNAITISVNGQAPVLVVLPALDPPADPADPNPLGNWQKAINLALTPVGAQVTATLTGGPTGSRYVEIRSAKTDGGSVVISPAAVKSAAGALQLGVGQGGLEVGGYAALRPAPTGFFAKFGGPNATNLTNFAGARQNDFGQWTLNDASGLGPHSATPTFAAPGNAMYAGTASTGVGVGSLLNVRENLLILADSINANTGNQWNASLQGFRLVLRPRFGGVNSDTTAALSSSGVFDIGANGQLFEGPSNVASYSLGATGIGDYQKASGSGQDGGVPGAKDYADAFTIIDRDVDLFNLMILPRANEQTDAQRQAVWGPASNFCLSRRAFLIVDPISDGPDPWTTVNKVESGIEDLRIGLATEYAAVYWPRLAVATNGVTKAIDPAGSIAGLMARIDSNRGVWKAPAGIEADIRGIRGVEHAMSDPENGIINPKAVNAIRVFATGVVSWGARTMGGFDNSGNDDYKYVPVRRLALFIEESLYRGLKFAVFQPNDEPLWAQIRVAAGAFMNNLFRQGAFQGQKASDAYFVKVDSETTTQNDINLGIVNVIVGFAPLKPAEFVVITIQQKAGQVQT
jgi:hypothetical protein